MIRLRDPGISAVTAKRLAEIQQEVDTSGSYAQQVAAAKELFPRHNRGDRPPFREVREALKSMCSGDEHCMYCEDAPADEVEHVHPKDLYPEVVFAWENFLFACGRCNGAKLARFRVFHPRGSVNAVDVSRSSGAPVPPPLDGDPLLIDPRREDPLTFLWLDLATFLFVPSTSGPARDAQRAAYTIDVLGLNRRDRLVRTRRCAYWHFRDHLQCYVQAQRANPAASAEQERASRLREMSHATVWAEMKRQRAQHPELATLFAAAPEALTW